MATACSPTVRPSSATSFARRRFAVAHLRDQDLSIDFSAVTTPEDRVAVIATVPLTDNECWTTMPSGSLWLFEEGSAGQPSVDAGRAGRAPARAGHCGSE
jgi:predicted glutamine amidotransferase